MTRTQNSFFNFIANAGSMVLLVLMNFVVRTVFIRTLGASYLGIEGYFTSILSMLSMAELGFGSAILFKLYKPIEEGDRRRIQVLMKLYRRVYAAVGWVIMGLGVALIPFLPRLIRDYGDLLTLRLSPALIFLLYLFRSASSYWFFAYKAAFVRVTQKSYVLSVAGYAVTVLGSAAQLLALVLTKSFTVYVIVMICQSLAGNLLYAYICDKRHPYLKEKIDDRVSREELREFFKDCSALFIFRINDAVISSTDNIVLTGLVGLSATGLYANYLIIKTNLQSLLNTFINSIYASLGSLYSVGNLEWSRLAFRVVNFCAAWLYGVGGVCLAVLMDEFIALWIGPRFIVSSWTVNGVAVATPLALWVGVECYFNGLKMSLDTTRGTMGLFRQMKYRPVLEMLVNLLVCLWLVPRVGIVGCVISTNCAALIKLIFDPVAIYRYALKQSPSGHFLRTLAYTAVLAAGGLVSGYVCGRIRLSGIPGFIVHGCVCVGLVSVLFAACFCRTREFRFLLHTGIDMLRRKTGGAPESE